MPSGSPSSRRGARLRSPARLTVTLVAASLLSNTGATLARAAPPPFVGVRAMGMGSALRAAATGDAGPTLNPSGMSLARTYVLEGAYQYLPQSADAFFHGSIVDSLSNDFLAAGFAYTYARAPSTPGPSLRAHDAALSVSVLGGARASFGATLKYLHVRQGETNALTTDGLTFDVGATLRPLDGWALAVVGTNLRDLASPQAPVGLTGGVAFTGVSDLILDVDALLDFGKETPGRGQHAGIVAGGEYLAAKRVAVRLGGGRDPFLDHAFFSAGLGVTNEMGAIDAGWRQDLSGAARQTYLGLSVRLFVPEPQASP